MRLNFYTIFLIFFLVFFVTSCAQEQTLVGGPEDLTQPELIYSIPKNMGTRFQDQKITVFFDRYVNIVNPGQNIVITPRPEFDPDYKLGTKSLQIKFFEKLRSNTTYIIQFGESVTSFRESKAVTQNLKLVFSTGREIDSASISGKVYDAHEGKPLAGVMVGLYNKMADSIPKVEKPLYFVKSDSLGNYILENIARGKYKIFALLDGNKNLIYDLPKEKIGFTDKVIEITDNKDTITGFDFWIFEQESKKQFVRDFKHEQMGKIDFFFSQPFRETKVEITSKPPLNFKTYWNKNKDTLRLWVADVPEEDKAVSFFFESKKWDSIPPVSVRLLRLKSKKYPDGEALDLVLQTKKFEVTEDGPLTFEFNRPIQAVGLDKIKILSKDSLRLAVNELRYEIDKKNPTLVSIYYPWKNGEYYTIELFRNAFIDAYNQTHAIFQGDFSVGQVNTAVARLIIKVDVTQLSKGNRASQYILELMKNDKEVFEQEMITKENSTVSFEKVLEGTYRLRIIMDKNKNGRWDTGDYEQKIQPERIFYYPDEITIKANFSQEIEWILNF